MTRNLAIGLQALLSALLIIGIWGLATAWDNELRGEAARTVYAESVSSDDGIAVATGLTNRTLFVAIPHAGQSECDHFIDVIAADPTEVKDLHENGFNQIQCLAATREIK